MDAEAIKTGLALLFTHVGMYVAGLIAGLTLGHWLRTRPGKKHGGE